ncbi:MAG: pilus assembly PilX N-terminal domain-containing protein [Phycisphaerae bacterium]|nr:pilus assembly PilX N-terminal domain-containing protein [Phycisphaerae bacterium]
MNTVNRAGRSHSRKGAAYLMSLIVLAVLTALGVGLADMGMQEFRKADNQTQSAAARFAAESGLNFAVYTLKDCQSELTLGDLPDMLDLVKEHLEAKLPNATVTKVTGDGDVEMVYVDSISYIEGRSFSLTVYVSAVDPDDESIATEMQLLSTGSASGISRTVGVKYDVDANKDLLTYGVAASIRIIVRGLDTVIDGDIASSWIPCRKNGSSDYPLDIGHTSSSYRNQENITVNGRIATTMTREEFEGDADGFSLNCKYGIRHTDMRSQITYEEPPLMDLDHNNFDTGMYRDRTERTWGTPNSQIGDNEKVVLPYPRDNIRGLIRYTDSNYSDYKDSQGQFLRGYPDWDTGAWVALPEGQSTVVAPNGNTVTCPRFFRSGSYLRWNNGCADGNSYVLSDAPDPDAPKVTCEYWSCGWNYWRARYDGHNGAGSKPVFKNLHIPWGAHAHFKNCTFTGITYVDADESTNLGDSEDYTKYTNIRHGLQWAGGNNTNEVGGNNIVFEDCTFEGPIVTGVPKHCRFKNHSLAFDGDTTFNSSAIRQELAGTTILAPNFNLNIGDVNETQAGSNSELVGLIVGGIVDIRDNAVLNGTMLSMANLEYLSARSNNPWYWGSNVGNWESSGEDSGALITGSTAFCSSEKIRITPDPDNVLPMGVKKRYTVILRRSSYTEYID